ncbi:hypothetical protein [Lentzea sp. NPDC059081]|uniref:hypothetical protein n=1 Tax=Lentzea sp. NPDC059081 TaxID=3346719 RepID=UPI003698DA3E
MSATTVQHLASVPSVSDEADDMKIYQFDREASMDWWWIVSSCGGNCSPGSEYQPYDEILAA